jgi:hypothetical protein
MIRPGATRSSRALLQQVIDGEVLLDQSQAAPQGVSGLLGRESLKAAVADAIVLTEITVNRLQTVVGLARDDVGLLPFGIALPANDALMSESRSHIVERRSPRDDGVGFTLMLGQQYRDPTIIRMEQLGEVAVGEQTTLFVSLLAQAKGLVQQPLGSGKTLDAQLHILGGGEVEEHGDEVGIDEALSMPRRIVDADGHPEDLSVLDVVVGTHVFKDDF